MLKRSRALVAAVLAVVTLTAVAQERDRDKVADKYKWNLAEIYPSVDAWRAAKEKVAAQIPTLRSFQGRLGTSAQPLADALEYSSRLDKDLSRLYVYASMLADQDTRVSAPEGLQR